MADFRRLYNWERLEYLQAPTAGWNPDAPVHLCPNNQAPVLDNLLPKPGKVAVRGPMSLAVDLSSHFATHNVGIHGAQPTTAGFLITSRTDGLAPPWQLDGTPFGKVSTTLYNIDVVNHTATVTTASDRDHAPGYRWIDYDGQLYGLGADSATILPSARSVLGVPAVSLQVNATSDGSAAPTNFSAAPHGAFDLIGYLERIWLLGGCDTPGGSTTHYNTAIYYTIAPLPANGGNSVSDWRDPVSGLTNVIRMDNDSTDAGKGLAKTRNGLLVFRERSVWILRGNTSDNFALQVVSRRVGCLDPRSIVETDQGVYFLSNQGLMLTDGISVRNVSGAVTETLRMAIARAVASGNAPAFSVQQTSRGQLLISILMYEYISLSGSSTSWTHSIFSGMYDPTYGTWCRITSDLFVADHADVTAVDDVDSASYPCVLLGWSPSKSLVSIGDRQVVTLEYGDDTFLSPSPGSRITPHTSGQTLYDNAGTAGSPDLVPIKARWTTKALALSNNSRKRATVKRWFLDYAFEMIGMQTPGWSVTPVDVAMADSPGTTVVPANLYTDPPAPGPTGGLNGYGPHNLIMRHDEDYYVEISDLAFDIRFADGSPPTSYPTSVVADLYGIGVEMMPGGDRFNGTS